MPKHSRTAGLNLLFFFRREVHQLLQCVVIVPVYSDGTAIDKQSRRAVYIDGFAQIYGSFHARLSFRFCGAGGYIGALRPGLISQFS
jgi:hypothetical protein